MSGQNRKTMAERSRESPPRKKQVVLTSGRATFLIISLLYLGGVNFLYVSGFYEWALLQFKTLNTVIQTTSLLLVGSNIIFIKLLKEDDD